MCELFGVTSAEKIECNDLLREFFSHGTEHPHGWGMAFFYGNAVSLEKQPEASYKSDYLKQRLRVPIREDKMIAHIRLATKGTVDYENSHPFVMRDNYDRTWTLAHNGTIFECDALNEFVHLQQGQTDSERILFYIISKINEAQEEKGKALSAEERLSLMDEIVVEITPENKVNLLIFDGEILYVHTNCEGSLHRYSKGKTAVISTQPLDDSPWEKVPMNTLVAYQNGEQIFTGTDHGNTYIETPEKMRLLFMDFSGL
ncbi:MAG: class II glutamine amidotransferase [Lachnospiraceae bacterium]|nr:class II glutamine amidotransferase [Lachnospiraceae bacterium]